MRNRFNTTGLQGLTPWLIDLLVTKILLAILLRLNVYSMQYWLTNYGDILSVLLPYLQAHRATVSMTNEPVTINVAFRYSIVQVYGKDDLPMSFWTNGGQLFNEQFVYVLHLINQYHQLIDQSIVRVQRQSACVVQLRE